MKTIVRFVALPLLAGLLGYAAGIALRAPEEKSRRVPAASTAASTAVVTSRFAASEPSEDAVASVVATFTGVPSLEDLASGMAAIERLSPQQMGALIERVLTMPGPAQNEIGERMARVGLLVSAWTAHDPEAATEWIRPRLDQFARTPAFMGGTATVETDLVRAWAENAPKIALEMARRFAHAEVGACILHNLIFAWPDKDYARRFEVLREFPPGNARQRVLRTLCDTWSRNDSAAALTGIASLPAGEERTEALRAALAVFAAGDPVGALSRAEAFAVADDAKTAQRLAMAAAEKAPDAVARWLEARDPAVLRESGSALVLRWAASDPAAAFSWAQQHGIDLTAPVPGDAESRDWMERQGIHDSRPMEIALEKKPELVIAWLRAQPAGAARDAAVEQTMRAMYDPQQMLPLLSMLPSEAAPQAATLIGQKFRDRPFEEGRRWAESLPAGPTRTAAWTALGNSRAIAPELPRGMDRDALLRGMAQSPWFPDTVPEAQIAHALAIDNPAVRRDTFDDVMSAWTSSPDHRRSAGPWLDRATVPQEWKAKWRERLK